MNNIIDFPTNYQQETPKFEIIDDDTIHITFYIDEIEESLIVELHKRHRFIFIGASHLLFIFNKLTFTDYTNNELYINGKNATYIFRRKKNNMKG